MKIAVACMGDQVAGHFGHCEQFLIYSCQAGAVTSVERLPNPEHQHGYLPGYLGDQGVTAVIAGGMGSGAAARLAERGIQAVLGATGSAEAAVSAWLRGELQSTGSICQGHDGEGGCHGHGHGEGCHGHGHGEGCHGHEGEARQ